MSATITITDETDFYRFLQFDVGRSYTSQIINSLALGYGNLWPNIFIKDGVNLDKAAKCRRMILSAIEYYKDNLTLVDLVDGNKYGDLYRYNVLFDLTSYMIFKIFSEEEFKLLTYEDMCKCYRILCLGHAPQSLLDVVSKCVDVEYIEPYALSKHYRSFFEEDI